MDSKEKQSRTRHFDRVTLDAPALDRIDSWINQVKSARLGVDLSRKDILNWLVVNLPETLSQTHEKALSDKFYNEVRYLRFAAKEIANAARRGEALSLKDLEERGRSQLPREPKARRPRKLKAETNIIESNSEQEAEPTVNSSTS